MIPGITMTPGIIVESHDLKDTTSVQIQVLRK